MLFSLQKTVRKGIETEVEWSKKMENWEPDQLKVKGMKSGRYGCFIAKGNYGDVI